MRRAQEMATGTFWADSGGGDNTVTNAWAKSVTFQVMISLSIVHRKKPNVFSGPVGSWRVFTTCLRSLAISFEETEFPGLMKDDQVFRGEAAYRFLLEVACGLQSPIAGETEVFGQFRRFADDWIEKAAFFQNVYADVKAVRQEYLSHLGSQSYGSWVRRKVQATDSMHILGSGQLAQEILVWLKKQNSSISLYSRTPEMAKDRLERALGEAMTGVGVLNIAAGIKKLALNDVIVVASPQSASDIKAWLGGQIPSLLIDLRDDSTSDPVEVPHAVRLADIFNEIESCRRQASEKIEKARAMVSQMAAKRFQSQTIRPFGWDDLCA